MSTSLVVHFKTDNGHRARVWSWVKQRWSAIWPELEIVESDDGGGYPIYNAAAAINRGVARSSGDVLIVADADVFMEPKRLRALSELVEANHSRAYSPWNYMLMIGESDTEELLDREPSGHISSLKMEMMKRRAEPWDHHKAPGSLIMVSREAYDLVGGNDERFLGWGGADLGFKYAIETLVGKMHRAPGVLFHMYHERLRDKKGNWVWRDQKKWYFPDLLEQYKEATHSREAMRALISKRGG